MSDQLAMLGTIANLLGEILGSFARYGSNRKKRIPMSQADLNTPPLDD